MVLFFNNQFFRCLKIAIGLSVIQLFLCLTACSGEPKNFSELLQAIGKKDLATVKKLVNKHNINYEHRAYHSPLHAAVEANSPEIVRFLVDQGADLTSLNGYNQTPLLATLPKKGPGAIKMLEILLTAPNELDCKPINQFSHASCEVLTMAVERNDKDKIELILEKRSTLVNKKTGTAKNTPLHEVKTVEVAKLILSAGGDPNIRNKWGNNALHECNDLEIAELLIAKGADVNARNKDGYTPLFYARDPNIVELLLNAGADVDIKNEMGLTALSSASGRKEALLLQAGADQDFKAEKKRAPILWAVEKGDIERVKRLLNKSPRLVNYHNSQTMTALHWACNYRQPEAVRLLLKAGADVGAKNIYGMTPLHETADHVIAKMLIQAGADVNARDDSGWTPLHRACSATRYQKEISPEIIKVLLSAGADPKATTQDGYTALYYAKGREDVIMMLKEKAPGIKASDPPVLTEFPNSLKSQSSYKGHDGPIWPYKVQFKEKKGKAIKFEEKEMYIKAPGGTYTSSPGYGMQKLHKPINISSGHSYTYKSWVSGENLCGGKLYLRLKGKDSEGLPVDITAGPIELQCKN